MSAPGLYVSEVTAEEEAAGFAVRPVEHPEGLPDAVPAAVHTWGDPSHRLVKTRGRDGQVVFQLQAFGRRAGAESAGWAAERYWPGRYGPAWVLDRLREHLGRPSYAPLMELSAPPAQADEPTLAGPRT
jgi:hypothetical protein